MIDNINIESFINTFILLKFQNHKQFIKKLNRLRFIKYI